MRTLSPLEITERTVEVYPFTGDWAKILGEPDIRFSTLIRSEAKSGKSTYCARFAQYIAQFGRVLYVSAEERLNSKTLQNRIKLCEVTNPNVRYVHIKDHVQIDMLIKTGKFRFIIIDSVQHVQMTYDQFENMRHKYKKRKLSWHLVMQMGVDISKWKHEVDVIVELKQGFAQVHGRYNSANRIQILKQNNQQQTLNL